MHAQSISRPASRCGSRQQRDRAVGVRNHVRRDRHPLHNEHHERPKLSRPPVLLLRRRRTAQHDFAVAADAYGVPEPVLLGVSYMESRRDDHGDHPSRARGYGPMHLTDVPLSDLVAAHAARGTRESRRVRSSARPVSTPSTRPASRPGLSVTDLKSNLHGRRLAVRPPGVHPHPRSASCLRCKQGALFLVAAGGGRPYP